MSSALASAKRRSLPPPNAPVTSVPPSSRQAAVPVSRQATAPVSRAGPTNNIPTRQSYDPAINGPPGQLTLQQVIDIYGRRIVQLEKTVKEITTGGIALNSSTATATPTYSSTAFNPTASAKLSPFSQLTPAIVATPPVVDMKAVEQFVQTQVDAVLGQRVQEEVVKALSSDAGMSSEWNARYELLAQEISEMKDMLLHLQDYTMNVNKKLLEGAVEETISEHIHTQILKHTQASIEQLEKTLKQSSYTGIEGTLQGDNIMDEEAEEEGVGMATNSENLENDMDKETLEDLRFLEEALAKEPEEYELNTGVSHSIQ